MPQKRITVREFIAQLQELPEGTVLNSYCYTIYEEPDFSKYMGQNLSMSQITDLVQKISHEIMPECVPHRVEASWRFDSTNSLQARTISDVWRFCMESDLRGLIKYIEQDISLTIQSMSKYNFSGENDHYLNLVKEHPDDPSLAFRDKFLFE